MSNEKAQENINIEDVESKEVKTEEVVNILEQKLATENNQLIYAYGQISLQIEMTIEQVTQLKEKMNEIKTKLVENSQKMKEIKTV